MTQIPDSDDGGFGYDYDYDDDCDLDNDGHGYDCDCDECRHEYHLGECGRLPDDLGGGCTMAGTEYCDFECPFRSKDE